jgi:hypothetical protein
VIDRFLALSAALTGFDEVELQGTGLAQAYLDALVDVIGEHAAGEFLAQAGAVLARGLDASARDEALTSAIMIHPRFGPLARNVVTMWYLGSWSRLPDGWYEDDGRGDRDTDRMISAAAYVEGLVWRAAGTHPPGAKQPGFGSWALKPR